MLVGPQLPGHRVQRRALHVRWPYDQISGFASARPTNGLSAGTCRARSMRTTLPMCESSVCAGRARCCRSPSARRTGGRLGRTRAASRSGDAVDVTSCGRSPVTSSRPRSVSVPRATPCRCHPRAVRRRTVPRAGSWQARDRAVRRAVRPGRADTAARLRAARRACGRPRRCAGGPGRSVTSALRRAGKPRPRGARALRHGHDHGLALLVSAVGGWSLRRRLGDDQASAAADAARIMSGTPGPGMRTCSHAAGREIAAAQRPAACPARPTGACAPRRSVDSSSASRRRPDQPSILTSSPAMARAR